MIKRLLPVFFPLVFLCGCVDEDAEQKRDSLQQVLRERKQDRNQQSAYPVPDPAPITSTSPSTSTTSSSSSSSEVFMFVEEMPEYPGGSGELMSYLQKNIEYPYVAKDAGIEGTVYVSFIVEKDGSVTGVQVIKGVHALLDEEAKRVFLKMPRWKPGRMNGTLVRVQLTQPVKFALQ